MTRRSTILHRIVGLTAFAVCLLASCTKADTELSYATQNEKIEEWVNSQLASHEEYSAVVQSSVTRLTMTEGEGPQAGTGSRVTMKYSLYDFSNYSVSPGNLLATNDSLMIQTAKWNVADSTLFLPVTVALDDDKLLEGLRRGLTGVRAGEHCMVVFSAKYGYGSRKLGTIPAMCPLAYEIDVKEIKNQ